jgi:hypothetical protein
MHVIEAAYKWNTSFTTTDKEECVKMCRDFVERGISFNVDARNNGFNISWVENDSAR